MGEPPPEVGRTPDPALPSRSVRIYILVAWIAASAFLFAATFTFHWTKELVCARCGSTIISIDGPVLLPMPGPEIIEVGDGADECDHEWRVPPNLWTISRSGSVGYGLGLLFWLVLAVRMGLSLARPTSRRARVTSLVLAAVAMVLVVGGDIWYLADLKSTVDECERLDVLTAGDLYDWRVLKAGLAWHMAASVVCFGGAAAWFAWTLHLPDPDADLDCD